MKERKKKKSVRLMTTFPLGDSLTRDPGNGRAWPGQAGDLGTARGPRILGDSVALPGKERGVGSEGAWKPMSARWGGTIRQKPRGSKGRSVG